MKFVLQFTSTVVLVYIAQTLLPWWTMALVAFALGYAFGNKGYLSFLAGFIGVGVLWLGMALVIDTTTQSILTQKVNQLLPVNAFVLTLLVGGLVGGLSSLTGSLLKAKK